MESITGRTLPAIGGSPIALWPPLARAVAACSSRSGFGELLVAAPVPPGNFTANFSPSVRRGGVVVVFVCLLVIYCVR